jgi:ribosomal protein S18 acetylase RimI-like enzyme
MDDLGAIAIRPFLADDRDRVTRFFDQMGGETRALFNRADGNRKTAMEFFTNPSPTVLRYLALEGDRMVGYVFLWDMDRGVPWLGVAVSEDWKGRRLGTKLLEHAHAVARERGKGGVLLTTAYGNLRGQGLYERMGYERLGMHTSGELLYILRFR